LHWTGGVFISLKKSSLATCCPKNETKKCQKEKKMLKIIIKGRNK
jgi:hypothetical protein